MSRRLLAVPVAVAALLLAGCGGGGSPAPAPTVTVTATPSPSPTCPTVGEFFQAWVDAGRPNQDSAWWGMYLVGCTPEQIDDLLDEVNGTTGDS